jgi:hypothetical protein
VQMSQVRTDAAIARERETLASMRATQVP